MVGACCGQQSYSELEYSNSMQKCTSGAVSHLEFYCHSSSMLTAIYWGKLFSLTVMGVTVLKPIRRNLVKYRNEKHEESREKYLDSTSRSEKL